MRRDARRAVMMPAPTQPVVAVEPEPDVGEAPVLYSRIRSQRDGWLMLLEAIRAGREPDQVEIRKLDEEEARWKVKRRPSPRHDAEGG